MLSHRTMSHRMLCFPRLGRIVSIARTARRMPVYGNTAAPSLPDAQPPDRAGFPSPSCACQEARSSLNHHGAPARFPGLCE
ncbi:hypothetical protein AAFF_G00060790 [Aldrovandia affinis]|uniref:Uncharacterized protein n=1 Tax=Aldrovandia affinis TaxID=143900 RepID=A0AAD7WDT9_9TELE|nr:hypothetical protein AAFF_G00060790 [Aldrovandia affinis]